MERINKAINIFDAAGLGLFCVVGTVKAHEYGLGLTSSAVLGLATAAGGGVLRDVLANEVPSLLRWDRDLYAVPAIVGATMTALLLDAGALNAATMLLAAALAFVRAAAGPALRVARAPRLAPALDGRGRRAGNLTRPPRCVDRAPLPAGRGAGQRLGYP